MVERYTEKVKKQNSGRGSKKIEGAWRNTFHKRNDDEIQFPSLSKSDTGRRYNGNTTSQGADIQFSREKSIQKRSEMSMEAAMQTQLADISQQLLDTLRKDQVEVNQKLRRDLEEMQKKINNVELKHERDVKEMKDSIQEVKQGNVVAK